MKDRKRGVRPVLQKLTEHAIAYPWNQQDLIARRVIEIHMDEDSSVERSNLLARESRTCEELVQRCDREERPFRDQTLRDRRRHPRQLGEIGLADGVCIDDRHGFADLRVRRVGVTGQNRTERKDNEDACHACSSLEVRPDDRNAGCL